MVPSRCESVGNAYYVILWVEDAAGQQGAKEKQGYSRSGLAVLVPGLSVKTLPGSPQHLSKNVGAICHQSIHAGGK